jgi:hypothetical protein
MYTCNVMCFEKLKVKHAHNCIPYNFLPTRSTTTTITIQLSCRRPHLLTRPGLTRLEVSLMFSPDSFCLFVCTLFIILDNLFTTINSVYMLHPISSVFLNFVCPLRSLYLFYKLSKSILIYFTSAAAIRVSCCNGLTFTVV